MPSRTMKTEARELITLCALNIFVEDSPTDQDDEDVLLAMSLLESCRYSSDRLAKPIPIIKNWWEDSLFSTNYSEKLFKTNFRMTRPAFWSLCQLLSGISNKI